MVKSKRSSKPSTKKRPSLKRSTTQEVVNNVPFQGQIYTKHNYFNDLRRKIDFVLVSNIIKMSEELDTLVTYLVNLLEQGVQFEFSRGKEHENLIFIKVHCPLSVLLHIANIHHILFDFQQARSMPVKTHSWFFCRIFNNITTSPVYPDKEYQRVLSTLGQGKPNTVTSWERSFIVEKILENTSFGPMPNDKGIKKLKKLNIILDAYAIHDGPWQWRAEGPLTDRQLLDKYWASLKCLFKNQPISLIYKYYGSEVAFHFAFVDYYTKMLTIPAIIGVLCIIYNVATCAEIDSTRITEICTSKSTMCPNCYNPKECKFTPVSDYCYEAKYNAWFENYGGIGFAIFTSIWATLFLGMWQRNEYSYKFRWNLLNCEMDTTQRIEFTYKTKNTRISPASGKRVNYMPTHVKFGKHVFTILCCALMTLIVVLLIILVIESRLLIRRLIGQSGFESSLAISLCAIESVIIIRLLTPFFWKMAVYLTNEENPATFIEYYNSCTYKYYYLSFVNNYLPIFYVAFIKGLFFTHPGDKSNYTLLGIKTDICILIGCTLSLTIYLNYFISYKTLVLKLLDLLKVVIRRRLKIKIKSYQLHEINDSKKQMPAWERDYTLTECGEFFLIKEFMELVIQYGFVVFFVAGLPLAPVIALIANIIQIRLDAKRILRFYRRPIARMLPGIGTWNSILRLVTFVGAMTNAFVIAFTTDLIDMEVYRQSHETLQGYINSTLSEFALKDYPEEFNELINKEDNNINVCSYKSRRNPYYDENKYRYSEEHWRVMFCKLCFVLVFQQMIWLITAICSNAINPISDEVLEELNEEAMRVRDVQFASLMQNFSHLEIQSRNSFQIT